MGVEIWFVRHGQTDWNIDHRLQGHQDTPLNATGVGQAAATASYLAGIHSTTPFDAIVTSDLSRAHSTAEAIASALRIPMRKDAGFREHNLGRLQGLTAGEMSPSQRREYELLRTDLEFNGHGGESSMEMATRVRTTLKSLQQQHSGQRVVVVTHGGFLFHSYRWIREMGVDRSRDDERTPNACICIVDAANDTPSWRIVKWGLTHHLSVAAL
ncbi:hypothetical protein H310_14915 [Aphanomyces invadans]|uniref:Phosphoglycerate mutase n=1 Tax=Aphanomyces invadans TaxID=157072 RepID=A0A024T864_9STRA|nr:hypothetical protein H310_14915 [Aphanomyces invadans]ETV90260.1 hypothetical protein H310_14915 [Aphanomyces invadans]|eukprot:XP_008881111.1 hypothetical protein H310_14915 [Aphanomyces invadans]